MSSRRVQPREPKRPGGLKQALHYHRAGSLDQAAKLYAEVLRQQPKHFDAMHLLGVVLFQQGRLAKGRDQIQSALMLNPHSAEALSNLAAVLRDLHCPEEALANSEKALAIRPNYPEALYNRGNALKDLARLNDAIASYDNALALRPNYPEALYNRGNALADVGRPLEALASYDTALAIQPDHAKALCNRGNLLRDLKHLDEALASYDTALAIIPDFVEVLCNRGAVLKDLKRLEEALVACDKALTLRPNYPEALYNRGNVLADLGRLSEALASYDTAIAIQPDHAKALCNRGNLLRDLKRLDEALASYDTALAIIPDFVEVLCNRGAVLKDLKRFEEALAACDKALAIIPDFVEVLCNRGAVLKDLKRFEEALAACDKALTINPDFVEALDNRGTALAELNRQEEALASYAKALTMRPDYADGLFNRAVVLLSSGRFSEGWRDYEYRWKRRFAPRRKLIAPYPVWNGQDIAGRSIIVYEEQGLGDIIQFSRFLKRLASMGADVTFLVRASMHRLLHTLKPAIRLIDEPQPTDVFDFQCALMTLPGMFETTDRNIPAEIPYLFAEDAKIADWRNRIGTHGLKIGICWQGNPDGTVDIGRSVPLLCLAKIATIAGVRLISLQKRHGLDQLNDLPRNIEIETLGEDFDSGPDSFIDTAAIMACVDLVISSDTSIAHLAGALGRPIWTVLKHVPDWRWLLDRSDSPWYPTMKLYRQQVRNDWDGVFLEIARDLQKMSKTHGAENTWQLHIPGSIGELLDKITILEIKEARINDPDKRNNVVHELGLLRSLEAQMPVSHHELDLLVAELKSVNETLWDIEENIRACESRHEFGGAFVSLARAVYKTNDRRAALKKQINRLTDSHIIEEKSYNDNNDTVSEGGAA